MVLQRHARLAIVALALLAHGCSSTTQEATVAPEAKPAADIPAARVDASRPSVDPRILPPPRAPLAGTPDLNNATFAVTDATLKAMAAAGLPPAQAQGLAGLKGRAFGNVTEFRAAVEDRIGKPAAETHMGNILRHALAVTLADVPEPPEGKADLQAAETLKRPQPQAAAPAAAVTAGLIAGSMGSDRFQPVFFDYDKSNIKKEFRGAIAANAGVLKADKNLKAVIEGHCDERGTTEYNIALGERRAEAVRKALLAAGVAEQQLKTVSYGEERPALPGHDEEAWSKNRRAVINLQ